MANLNNDYENHKNLCDKLKNIAKKYNLTIVTATQPKRDDSFRSGRNVTNNNNIVIIDHLNLLKK